MDILIVSGGLLSTINCIQETVSWFYHAVLLVGYLIVLGIFQLYKVICVVIESAVEVLNILDHDLDIFTRDVSSGVEFLCTGIYNFVLKLSTTFQETSSSLSSGITKISEVFKLEDVNQHEEIQHFLFVENVQACCGLVLDALSLIGCTACQIIQNVYFAISIIPDLPHLVFYIVKERVICLWTGILYLFNYDAFCGLLVVTGLSIFGYRIKLHKKIAVCCKILALQLFLSSIDNIAILIYLFITSGRKLKQMMRKTVRSRDICDSSKFDRDELERLLEREKAEKLCVICFDKKRNAMLMNCKHLILCYDCAYVILGDTGVCPVCRKYIFDIITVYT